MPKQPPPITRHAVTASTEEQSTRLQGARMLPLMEIKPNPWQPRQHASEVRLQELTADIAARGILEPIIVRPEGEGYEIVAGERRYRAAIAAGLTMVPVIVRDDLTEENAREISLVENLLREDLDIEDEARFLKALYDQKKSLRAVGDAIHKSYQYVNRRLKLLGDPGTMLAYREGLVKLDDLIAGKVGAEQGTGPDTGSEQNTETKQSGSETDEGQAVTARSNGGEEVEEVRFYRSRSVFMPIHKLLLRVQDLRPAEISGIERPKVRGEIRRLIDMLTSLERSLEEEPAEEITAEVAELQAEMGSETHDADIELTELEDGRAGWAVKRPGW